MKKPSTAAFLILVLLRYRFMPVSPTLCFSLPLCVLFLLAVAVGAPQRPYLHAPSVTDYAKHDPNGLTILPTGRYLKPVGRHFPVARWPHGLVLSPDGATLFIASDGVGHFATGWETPSPTITPFSSLREGVPKHRSNTGGAAFSPDGKKLYWCSGESGEVYVVDVATRKITDAIALNVEVNGQRFADSWALDVKASADGSALYCADVTNFRVVVIDTVQRKVAGSVRVGRYPYALAVAGSRLYVANIGMFEYSAIPSPAEGTAAPGQPVAGVGTPASTPPDSRGLTFPPFGFPSREAREGVDLEGRRVPGPGDPNAPESFSVWGIDVSDPARPCVFRQIKTGLLVGAPSDRGKTVGGSAPNFLAVHGDRLYVSNGNNDTIEQIDLRTGRIAVKTRITPSPLVSGLRGVGPSGMVVSPDGRRLYVAESGINAVGVLDAECGKVLGHIPTGWYPYRVTISPDGRQLCCISFRGFGNGPNAGNETPDSPYLGLRGLLSVLDVPSDVQLREHTANVLAYNGIVDRSADRATMAFPIIPTVSGQASCQIRYVVFITKENHTYDTIFDHIPGARDDPSLLRWGLHERISAPGQPTLEDAAVMVNHNALARQFTVSDNFYMEPEASGAGHRWLVGVQPNNFCQMTYTLGWRFNLRSTAPGRRASFESNGSIAPEDYPEAGAMWEHLARHGVGFRNYGEGFEFAGVNEGDNTHRTGAREVINMPMSKVLFDNTCREFPIFNMNIPDQYRAHWFEQDFTRLFLRGKQEMPAFVNIAICNDHGDTPQPARGYPYVASWMADNDLALGRIVEFLSHTPYWKQMAIFVTEDDAGGEPDHVDAQRSVLLVISPWARRCYVSHRQTTIVSMHRTLYEILGLPPLNLFDALANDFSDCFTTTPDFRPYRCLDVDLRIFDPEKAKDPKDPEYRSARLEPGIKRDDPDDEEEILDAAAAGTAVSRRRQ